MSRIEEADIILSEELQRSSTGAEVVRGFMVVDLISNGHARTSEALNTPGVPTRGQVHPSIPTINVSILRVELQDNQQALVIAEYKSLTTAEAEPDENAEPTMHIGATVQGGTTSLDFKGNQMLLDHSSTTNTLDAEGKSYEKTLLKLPTQSAEVEVQFPSITISTTRKENSHPLFKAKAYVGKINSRPIFAGNKHEWLCTGIDGDTDDGGKTYTVTYSFQLAPDNAGGGFVPNTWNPIVVYIDPETNAPIATKNNAGGIGPLPDVGIKQFQVYQDADFNRLNIDFLGSSGGGQTLGLHIIKAGTSRRNTLNTGTGVGIV